MVAASMSRALDEALALRRAAEAAGGTPRRRRAAPDDDNPVGWPQIVAAPEPATGAAVATALGWPGSPVQLAPDVPSPVGAPPAPAPPAAEPPAPAPAAAAPPAPAPPPPTVRPPVGMAARPPQPRTGWRNVVISMTRGRLTPRRSRTEIRRQELTERVHAPVSGCHRIAVISLKGGVGKTTMSVCLGATLASIRADRAIVVDANPDRGTLSGKVPQQTEATIRDLLEQLPQVRSYAHVREYTSQSVDRLEVLASAADPAISDAFGEADYRRILGLLEEYYSLVLTDCGTGLLHSAMSGVLDLADQLVVVSTASVDGARSASATLDWLEVHGRGDLVRSSVAVVNAVRPGSGAVDIDRLEAHFASRCRAVVRVPHDAHLETGAEVELDQLRAGTRDAVLRLAAEVAGGFSGGQRRP